MWAFYLILLYWYQNNKCDLSLKTVKRLLVYVYAYGRSYCFLLNHLGYKDIKRQMHLIFNIENLDVGCFTYRIQINCSNYWYVRPPKGGGYLGPTLSRYYNAIVHTIMQLSVLSFKIRDLQHIFELINCPRLGLYYNTDNAISQTIQIKLMLAFGL